MAKGDLVAIDGDSTEASFIDREQPISEDREHRASHWQGRKVLAPLPGFTVFELSLNASQLVPDDCTSDTCRH